MSTDKNQYFLRNQDQELELKRLIDQSRAVNSVVGDLIPPTVDPENLRSVLDVGCGSGDWGLEVAATYSDCEVIGIDYSPHMIKYATAQARAMGLKNIKFMVGNALETPLSFPDQHFSLINSRFSASYILCKQWPLLIADWRRMLQPGGCLNVVEIDLGVCNSYALGQLYLWIAGIAALNGASFGQGFSLGTVAVLPRMLREAGFQDVQKLAYPLDWSAGTEHHDVLFEDALTIFHYMKPMFASRLNVSSEKVDATMEAVQLDAQREDFCSLGFVLSVFGFVP